ncbi:MAG: type II toxin-antitoxin system YafQ family toxin [Catonella sp.]|uniref:type II toxin-antitoxin system YafQ family toxin n=1 Tax=Catonella sp. TaxID=2382125 RepID=UPI003F9F9143
MRLNIVVSNQFKKDLKLASKRGFDIDKLKEVVDKLAEQSTLDKKYKDHNLLGEYKGFRECHIEPDWLLIYRIDKSEVKLFLFRAGSHSDLF